MKGGGREGRREGMKMWSRTEKGEKDNGGRVQVNILCHGLSDKQNVSLVG